MNTYLKVVVFTIAAFFIVTPARAGWHFKYFQGKNQSAADIEREISEWINNEGRPKDLNSIKGFLSQSLTEGKGGHYNIYVYVDSVEGTQSPIRVQAAHFDWLGPTKNGEGTKSEEFYTPLNQTKGNVVILGFYGGRQANSIIYVY